MISSDIHSRLRPWQPAIVEATLNGLDDGNFLNASGLGTGKTYVAMAVAKALKMRVAALCRLGAISAWYEAADHFGIHHADLFAINREQVKTGRTWLGEWQAGERNEFTGQHSKHFLWKIPSDTLLIFDEVHAESGLTSANSEMLRAAVRQGVKLMGLSGTAADDPRKMRAIGFMLGLHKDDDFWQWLSLQGATKDSWTFSMDPDFLGKTKGKEELGRRRLAQMAKINYRLVTSGRMINLPTSAIPGFPQCTVQPMCVSFDSKELQEIFEQMKEEFAKLNQKGIGGKGLGVLMPRLQKAEMLMVPEIIEETLDAIADGNSVVIFVNFKDTVAALAKRLKTDCIFTGDQDQDEKDHARKLFQSDAERKIIVNTDAGGESIGFHDLYGNFPRVGIVIPSFKAVSVNQLLGRLPRAGAMSPSVYRLLFPKGTWLERAYHACKRRTELYGAFNGADVRFTDEDLLEGLAA